MNPLRVLIVDDERIAIELIRELIRHFAPDFAIADTARDGHEAVQKIQELRPDLVFLDVDMPYINGMEVVQKLPQQTFYVIFTTGYESKELKTLRRETMDYLLKPIDPADFVAAVEKVRQWLAMKTL